MPVQPFNPTDVSQSTTNWDVACRFVAAFAPRAQLVPSMSIQVDPGHLLKGTVLVELNAQTVGPFSATPSARVDRVVVDRVTGAASIVSGTDGSTAPPSIPSGKLPVARVYLRAADIVVTNEMIFDERALADVQPAGAQAIVFRAHMNGTDQSLSVQTATLVNLVTTSINVGGCFDTTTKKFQPTIAGYYQVSATISYGSLGSDPLAYFMITKNGSVTQSQANFGGSSTGAGSAAGTDIVEMNGTTDYLQLFAYYRGSAGGQIVGHPYLTWFAATRLIT